MEIMISINPPYTDMIFNKYKFFEFRKKILNKIIETNLDEKITAYIYETKNKGGSGTVIGEVNILGAYKLYYGKNVDSSVEEERSKFMKDMYLKWCSLNNVNPMDEKYFKSEEFMRYQKKIGFTDGQNIVCNYAIMIGDVVRYEGGRPLTNYFTAKGKILRRPPQNMFNIKSVI